MKNIVLLLIVTLFTLGCARQASPVGDRPPQENLVIKNGENEEEYALIIIDPQFRSWFATHAKPVNFHSESYYESQNIRYVNAWNERYYATGGRGPFGNHIDYHASEDYGLALNYELFWYFKYIESQFGSRYNFPI